MDFIDEHGISPPVSLYHSVIIAWSCPEKKTKTKPRTKVFVRDNVCDEQTKPLVLNYFEVLVRSGLVTGLFQNIQEKATVLFYVSVIVFILAHKQALTTYYYTKYKIFE